MKVGGMSKGETPVWDALQVLQRLADLEHRVRELEDWRHNRPNTTTYSTRPDLVLPADNS